MHVVVLKMKELYDDLCQSRLNKVIQNESCDRIFMLYNTYFEKLRTQSGQIASFWMSYINHGSHGSLETGKVLEFEKIILGLKSP